MNADTQVQLTEIFLTGISILAVALAAARNEKLKTGLSIAGIAVSVAWAVCMFSLPAAGGYATVVNALDTLPLLALVGWLISAAIHGWNWWQGVEPDCERCRRAAEV